MRRRTLLALAAFAPVTINLACAQDAAPVTATLAFDNHGRPVADVFLNDQGPFALVLDTAAGATALSPATIENLALSPNGMRANVHGASGATAVELYTIERARLGGLESASLIVAPLPNNPSALGHAGVLGAGVFAGTRTEFDLAGHALRVDQNGARSPLAGAALVQVEFRHGIFALAPIAINGVAATAVLDTGARRSVANTALRVALGFADGDPRLREAEAIGGATAHTTPTLEADVDSVRFAGTDFGAFELDFAALPVFASLQLQDRPALILGMDVISRWRGFVLDYASGQLQVRA